MHDSPQPALPEWKERLDAVLPLYGHRNWIVVADSAYPAQSNPGIETIVGQSKHIRVNVYADKELAYVAESDAPGVLSYCRRLESVFKGANVNYLPHEQIIHKLDQSAQLFRILLIKTDMSIPYTSIFFELECGYWNAEAEQRLRKALAAASD